MVRLFVWGAAGVTAAHAALLVALVCTGQLVLLHQREQQQHDQGQQQHSEQDQNGYEEVGIGAPAMVGPLVLLAALCGAIAMDKIVALDWERGVPQAAATLLLLAAPFALEGSFAGLSHTRTAVLWAAVAMQLPCVTTDIRSRKWYCGMVVYLAVLFGFTGARSLLVWTQLGS